MLEKWFQLRKHQTRWQTEILAGVTTFFTMSYIIFLNPSILMQTGMDAGALFTATCLIAAFGSAFMGLFANYPIALAPGMALNTYFTYGVVLGAGHPWPVALGAVFISGVIFFLLTLSPLCNYLIESIPKSLKIALVAGLGAFIFIIGFKNCGFWEALHSANFTPTVWLALLGFGLILLFETLNLTGSMMLSIVIVSVLSMWLGFTEYAGIFSSPPSIKPIFMQLSISGAVELGLVTIIFAFLFVDLFDNTGTLIAIAHRAGLMDAHGKLPRLRKALTAASLAALGSGIVGTSTTTSYLESTVGVKAGARTGLSAVTVAICFIGALFFAPLAKAIPLYAASPALIYVALLMVRAIKEIDYKDWTEGVPALVTALTIPITFSVADGMAWGFISYTAIKIISKRYEDLNVSIIVLTLIFISKYLFP